MHRGGTEPGEHNHDDGDHDHDHNHDDNHYGDDGDHHDDDGKVRQGLSVQHVMLRDAQRNCKWCNMYVGERDKLKTNRDRGIQTKTMER